MQSRIGLFPARQSICDSVKIFVSQISEIGQKLYFLKTEHPAHFKITILRHVKRHRHSKGLLKYSMIHFGVPVGPPLPLVIESDHLAKTPPPPPLTMTSCA